VKLYGLIGYPLGHSFSKRYFTKKFIKEKLNDHSYLNFPIENIEKVLDILKNNPDLLGFNVTIPYKKQIISFLNEISKDASDIGAVNTVLVDRKIDKINLSGYNTDIDGFKNSLIQIIRPDIKHAIILGSGGAAKAVGYVLDNLKIEYKIVSRKGSAGFLAYRDLDKSIMETHQLIINTTPLGTFPEVNTCPDIPYRYISASHILFDLVYNPSETLFLL